MPLYEYRCAACGQAFESVRRASERAAPIDCPACGTHGEADRLWSTVVVRVRARPPAPRSGAEALAGPGVRGLGTVRGHGRTSIVQSCGTNHLSHRH
ncbi:MAG TPA: zinc ribbon domain-containing protein [Polyangia bacterium]|jgi:putative FmdB family regulatory protein|nr:zinc ribbon domain-containing protein [Polyangia bacterium]